MTSIHHLFTIRISSFFRIQSFRKMTEAEESTRGFSVAIRRMVLLSLTLWVASVCDFATVKAQDLPADPSKADLRAAIEYADKQLDQVPREALRVLRRVRTAASEHPEIHITTLLREAELFQDIYRADSALYVARVALSESQRLEDAALLCEVYNTLSSIYFNMEDFRASRDMAERTLELAERDQWPKRIASAHYTLGSIYAEFAFRAEDEPTKRKYSDSAFYHLASIMDTDVDTYDKMISTNDWALIESNLGNHELADSLFAQALVYFQNEGDIVMEANAWNNRAYNEIDRSRLENATEYIRRAWELVEPTNLVFDKAYISESASEVFKKAERYDEALKFHEIHHRITDSLATVQVQSNSALIQSQLENKLLRTENDKAALKIKLQRIFFIGLGVFVVLLLVLVGFMVHQRKKREELMARISEQNRELEEHGKFKNRIISMISHDFRTPLNTLKSVIELANIGGLDKEDYRRLIAGLDGQLKQTSEFISDLLLWARVQIKGESRENQSFKVADVLKTNRNLLSRELEKKDLQVNQQCASDLVWKGDKEVVSMAFRNILQNAIKFSPPSGVIDVNCHAEEDRLSIEVRDYGQGMDAEKAKDMFGDCGEIGHGTFNERGSGLGLPLTHDLVRYAGGKIVGKNYPGEGLSMALEFPQGS